MQKIEPKSWRNIEKNEKKALKIFKKWKKNSTKIVGIDQY